MNFLSFAYLNADLQLTNCDAPLALNDCMNAVCRLRIVLVVPLFFLILPVIGQVLVPDRYIRRPSPVKTLTKRDGLSHSYVQSIWQDRYGFMWFGTNHGLNRYDGYQFKVYQHDPQDQVRSLSNGGVRALHEGQDSVLWVGTFGGGIGKYDRNTETFTTYTLPRFRDDKSVSSNNSVQVLAGGSGNTLWVGTWGGLFHFDPKGPRFTLYEPLVGGKKVLKRGIILSIFSSNPDELWVGTLEGLHHFNLRTGVNAQFVHHPADPASLSGNWVSQILKDRAGGIWVVTDQGLDYLDDSKGNFVHISPNPVDKGASNQKVISVCEDHAGTIWAETPAGLCRVDTPNRKLIMVQPVDPQYNPKNALSLKHPLCIDRSGVLWSNLPLRTVKLFNTQREKFVHYQPHFNQPATNWNEKQEQLKNGAVNDLYEDKKGLLWLAAAYGIARFNPSDNTLKVFPGYTGFFYEDHKGKLLLVNRTNDLKMIDTDQGRIIPYPDYPRDTTGVENYPVRTVCEDATGNLWMGIYGDGLIGLKGEQVIHYRQTANPAGLRSNFIEAAIRDRRGQLWLAYGDAGLSSFDPQTGKFRHYPYDTGNATDKLNDQDLTSLYEDAAGILWIGTSTGGLNRLDPATGHFTAYTTKNGLPSNYVLGITGDRNNQLWISTSQGIGCFNPATGACRNYGSAEGIPTEEFYLRVTPRKGRSGHLYLGSTDGFTAFHPDSLPDNTYVPPVHITGFRLFDKPQPFNHAGITLAHHENHFGFDFVALNYINSEKNQYAYKLD